MPVKFIPAGPNQQEESGDHLALHDDTEFAAGKIVFFQYFDLATTLLFAVLNAAVAVPLFQLLDKL